MPSSQLPIEALPAWAHLNNVEFHSVKLGHTAGRGCGLVADRDLSLSAGSGAHDDDDATLLRVPCDTVLSAYAIDEYTKVDQNFRQLLDVAGRQSSRHDIMLYLLSRHILPDRNQALAKGVASTPWTEYVKFLPRHIPVPTLWSEDERSLLQGTSLEASLDATPGALSGVAVGSKLAALTAEFDELRDRSSDLPFWNTLLWEKEAATINDWVLIDAWYRSRCLELPRGGHAMVPALDMANHSSAPTAYYEENDEGDVIMLLRPESTVLMGQEVTISYGDAKPAAEMLFSYGFVDEDATTGSRKETTLPLDSFPDDPLAKVKLHAYGGPPSLRLFRTEGAVHWDAPFVHFMCLNEEDGLDFRVLQGTDGERHLRLFWQDSDVTGQANEFESLTENHPLRSVFRLRAVAVLHEQISTQLERIRAPLSPDQLGGVREEYSQAAQTLRRLETELLEDAAMALDSQQSNLLADDQVKAYLGLTEDTQNGNSPTGASNEDVDFS